MWANVRRWGPAHRWRVFALWWRCTLTLSPLVKPKLLRVSVKIDFVGRLFHLGGVCTRFSPLEVRYVAQSHLSSLSWFCWQIASELHSRPVSRIVGVWVIYGQMNQANGIIWIKVLAQHKLQKSLSSYFLKIHPIMQCWKIESTLVTGRPFLISSIYSWMFVGYRS